MYKKLQTVNKCTKTFPSNFNSSLSPFNLFEQRYANESVKFHIPFDLVSIGGGSSILESQIQLANLKLKFFRPISKINGYVGTLFLLLTNSRGPR